MKFIIVTWIDTQGHRQLVEVSNQEKVNKLIDTQRKLGNKHPIYVYQHEFTDYAS